jgi:DNA polymerase-3 subunit gamma/tau
MNGYADVKDSPRPLASLDMALVKLAYAADLPGPEEALRKLSESGGVPAAPRLAPPAPSGGPRAALAVAAPVAAPSAAPRLTKFEDVVAMARAKRDVALLRALEHDMRIARFEPGRIEFTPTASASPTLAPMLAKKLQDWTGERWMIAIARDAAAAPTLRETAEAREEQKREGAAAHPVVRKVMEQFPGARIVAVRAPEVLAPEAPPPTDDDVGYSEPPAEDDDL